MWGSYFWGCSRRRPTDRPTDRPPPRSELLLAPPLSFFYTHTRHTHVDSLTHTRQTHTRSLTVPFAHGARAGASLDTHTVDAHTFAHGARARFTLDTHLGASRLVSAGRGSTSGSGRCPSAFRGPPPLDAARRSTWEPRGSFLLAGAALQALDGARARFGAPLLMLPGAALGSLAARFCWQFRAPPLDAARRSTWEPRGSFLLAGAALQGLDGTRARFLDAARRSTWSLAARFCWQGQHFRLWTVPERVSGRAALQALDGTRARFGAPPPLMLPGAALGSAPPLLDAARRSTWEPRGSFLLAGAALQALDGARARFGAPPLMLPGAALGSQMSSSAGIRR